MNICYKLTNYNYLSLFYFSSPIYFFSHLTIIFFTATATATMIQLVGNSNQPLQGSGFRYICLLCFFLESKSKAQMRMISSDD